METAHRDKKINNVSSPAKGVNRPGSRKAIKLVVGFAVISVALAGTYFGYIYALSPAVIRSPKLDHYHFRMQVLLNGQAENFAKPQYQEEYDKNQCNTNLPEQPIHFHDNKDQLVHIHWDGITGGMVMKYYGWNFIGGMKNALGYRVNSATDIQKVTIHGNVLPDLPDKATIHVYTGDENNYTRRDFNSFIQQDLEDFFGKASNFPRQTGSNQNFRWLNPMLPKAYAHGTEDHSEPATDDSDEQLARINNLIGNVVVFVQTDQPSDKQIKQQFNKLEPLSESTCGG
jgi:hypothetical protein